jgi:hypothetical protein
MVPAGSIAPRRDEDVPGLHVAMDESSGMRHVKGVAEL